MCFIQWLRLAIRGVNEVMQEGLPGMKVLACGKAGDPGEREKVSSPDQGRELGPWTIQSHPGCQELSRLLLF